MNVKLLRKVARHILAMPKRFYMPEVVRQNDGVQLHIHRNLHPTGKTRPYPPCGTAACIAGWACLLSGIEPFRACGNKAAELLELDPQEANRLFFMVGPKRFRAIWTGDGMKKTAKLAAARIEHFIKTKGAE